MLNLSGLIESQSILAIDDMVSTRFKNKNKFKTPESLILYEQSYLDRETLLQLCNEQYSDIILEEPTSTFVPNNIVDMFRNSNAVPIKYIPRDNEIQVIYIPEYEVNKPDMSIYNVKYIPSTLHYFIENFTRVYGDFEELLEISGKVALNMIIEEAISKGIPDLTISNQEQRVIVYYNRLKRKEMSNHIFPKYIMDEIIKVITLKTPIADLTSKKPKYIGYEIDDDYRARIVVNKVYYGHSLSIRLLPNSVFNTTLEELNINKEVIEMLRDEDKGKVNGLRFIVGETMSGKNTTALAILKEIVDKGDSKVVSVEIPVEQVIHGVEQIGVEYIEEYVQNIESLIHQNPDYVYITETKDETGIPIMKVANTGKKVLSTLHSNSVEDTISRITDITGLSSNRVIQVLHSIIHQELIDMGGKLYPKVTYVYFDEEFKLELYDKPFGEVIKLIRERKEGGLPDGLL